MRARLGPRLGSWPAFWTLGASFGKEPWPRCGEIDIMEYYQQTLLANVYHGTGGNPAGSTRKKPLADLGGDTWAKQFNTWTMQWDDKSIDLLVDGKQLNHFNIADADRPDGSNPFRRPQYLLLNQAVGGTCGGDPARTDFPLRLEVDWVRVYHRP